MSSHYLSTLYTKLNRRDFLKLLLVLSSLSLNTACSSETEDQETENNPSNQTEIEPTATEKNKITDDKTENEAKNEAEIEYYDTVIIGAGISGLTTAFLLKDKKILILEKETTPGGRIVSGEWEGFHYPKGTEYIGPPEGEVKKLLNKLDLDPIKIPPPTDGIAYDGDLYYGEDILDFLDDDEDEDDFWDLEDLASELDIDDIEEAIQAGPTQLANFADLDNKTVADWLNENEIGALLQHFFDVENRGLFGASNQDLSFLFNIPEMAYNVPDPDQSHKSAVYTFPKGIFEIVEALVDELSEYLLNEATVQQVQVNNNQSVSITYHHNGQTHLIQADSVVLTTPAPITASIVTSGFSSAVQQALNNIPYTVYVTLNLYISERLLTEAWTVSCLDTFFVTVYDAIRTQVDLDYEGKSVLGIYIAPTHAADTTLLELSNDQILERTLQDLENYVPDIRDKILGFDLHRFKYAFPVFGKNYHQILNTLINNPSTQGPLFLAGDYMVYATLDGAVSSAFRAYEQVIEYL